MSKRDSGMPGVVVEVLRFCIVVFAAGVGFSVSQAYDTARVRVGPFDSNGIGILLGAAVGYVLGGVLARLTGRTLRQAEAAILERSAEQLLAGLAGAVLGVMLSAGLMWPVLLVGSISITGPIFFFVTTTVGTLGYSVGLAQREGILSLLGSRRAEAVSVFPRIIDTSVAIDGRIVDVVRAGFMHGRMLVPQPVIEELQGLADAGDDTRRSKGRRGLQALEALQRERGLDVEVIPDEARGVPEVDAKLIRISIDRDAALLTLDTNLARAASLAGCRVMNLHALSLALRPPVSAGDLVAVLLTRPGKEPGQAVGYLDDGTMVVVEKARSQVGAELRVAVTSVLTTANGRMVFARPEPVVS